MHTAQGIVGQVVRTLAFASEDCEENYKSIYLHQVTTCLVIWEFSYSLGNYVLREIKMDYWCMGYK